MTAPDFREIRQMRGFHPTLREVVYPIKDDMMARGATWCRLTILPDDGFIIVDGWLKRPDEEDPPPTIDEVRL